MFFRLISSSWASHDFCFGSEIRTFAVLKIRFSPFLMSPAITLSIKSRTLSKKVKTSHESCGVISRDEVINIINIRAPGMSPSPNSFMSSMENSALTGCSS